jgi:hypothetical protein
LSDDGDENYDMNVSFQLQLPGCKGGGDVDNSRGRVTQAELAQPPPVFSVSVHFDDEDDWDSAQEQSVESDSDFEDLQSLKANGMRGVHGI